MAVVSQDRFHCIHLAVTCLERKNWDVLFFYPKHNDTWTKYLCHQVTPVLESHLCTLLSVGGIPSCKYTRRRHLYKTNSKSP